LPKERLGGSKKAAYGGKSIYQRDQVRLRKGVGKKTKSKS